MYATTVRLDRVSMSSSKWTTRLKARAFSIEFDGCTEHGLHLPGRAQLRSGALVTAVLGAKNNWQTLLAVLDHETGVIIRNEVYDFSGLPYMVMLLPVLLAVTAAFVFGGPLVYWPALVACLGYLVFMWTYSSRKQSVLERSLVASLYPAGQLCRENGTS